MTARETTERAAPKFREGQHFNGTAFGLPIRLQLWRVEWFTSGDGEPFWTWHTTQGGMIAEHVLIEEGWTIAPPMSENREVEIRNLLKDLPASDSLDEIEREIAQAAYALAAHDIAAKLGGNIADFVRREFGGGR